MGLCSSKAAWESAFARMEPDGAEVDEWERKQNKQINVFLKERFDEEKTIVKLLLLGSGESGKSTLFKQLNTIYGDGFKKKEELKKFTSIVYSNVYSAMTMMLEYATERLALDMIKGLHIEGQVCLEEMIAVLTRLHTDRTQEQIAATLAELGATAGQLNIDTLMDSIENNYDRWDQELLRVHIRPQAMAARDAVLAVNHNTDCYTGGPGQELKLGEEMANHIQLLWKEPVIQEAYRNRSMYNLFDSCAYFMERIQTIGAADYCPTQDDCCRTRTKTTGICHTSFDITKGNSMHKFVMYDVGGQRCERKKWIHCFENVTAIIFVASLSGYNQIIMEYDDDDQPREVNRMDESLNLFEDIVNSNWFKNTATILFLNKEDLFKELLPQVPLCEYFPDYVGDNSFEDATDWIKRLYLECLDDGDSACQHIYVHVTCATNTSNIQVVFDVVKDVIISENLQKSGLAGDYQR